MKVTLSVIKADIGSIGGHIRPSAKLLETVRSKVAELGKGLLIDTYIGFTGDDVAILMSHTGGTGNAKVHKLAWDAFIAGTAVAKAQGLYGAGQPVIRVRGTIREGERPLRSQRWPRRQVRGKPGAAGSGFYL